MADEAVSAPTALPNRRGSRGLRMAQECDPLQKIDDAFISAASLARTEGDLHDFDVCADPILAPAACSGRLPRALRLIFPLRADRDRCPDLPDFPAS
jgi:hypothetical protein